MLKQESTDHINGKILVADKELIESSFHGEVIAVDLGRGFKIKFKNTSVLFTTLRIIAIHLPASQGS